MATTLNFGMRTMTERIMTLYYRPPELLLGDTKYSHGVDVWAMGCVIAEMFIKEPLFKSRSEFGMLMEIFQVLGSPKQTGYLASL